MSFNQSITSLKLSLNLMLDSKNKSFESKILALKTYLAALIKRTYFSLTSKLNYLFTVGGVFIKSCNSFYALIAKIETFTTVYSSGFYCKINVKSIYVFYLLKAFRN